MDKIPDISELTKVSFRSGDTRNCTDYYYHSKTKRYYSNYWGDGHPGVWKADPEIDLNDAYIPSVEKIEEQDNFLNKILTDLVKKNPFSSSSKGSQMRMMSSQSGRESYSPRTKCHNCDQVLRDMGYAECMKCTNKICLGCYQNRKCCK